MTDKKEVNDEELPVLFFAYHIDRVGTQSKTYGQDFESLSADAYVVVI